MFVLMSYYPVAGVLYTFGYVNSIIVLQVGLCFLAPSPVEEKSSLYVLLRSQRRQSFWAARVLGSLLYVYGLVTLLALVGMMLTAIIHGTLFDSINVHFPSIDRLSATGIKSILLMVNLLSLGVSSVFAVMDVLQLLLNSAIAAYGIVATLLFVSAISYLIPTKPISYIIFQISPFLRMSLLANLFYRTSPANSLLFLLLLHFFSSLFGRLLFTRKEITA
ncbi:MAG: hypothetical protein OWR62_15305 [Sulfobacillus thermotolerans]|nr:hypothetical protein [Sulfobacillus thermotolerans]